MPRFDHHLHTTRHSPDSLLDPKDLIERARQVGLDGIVLTEHDHQWHPDELADLARRAGGLCVLSGAEVSAREGHFLVYGLPDLADAPAGIPLAELIPLARHHGAAIVAAHPFRWDQDFDDLISIHGPAFDALELVSNNVTPETRLRTERLLAAEPTMGATGSSDAHDREVVGCYFTEFPGPIATIGDFAAALRARLGRPGHRPGATLTSGPVDWAPAR